MKFIKGARNCRSILGTLIVWLYTAVKSPTTAIDWLTTALMA